MGMTENWRGKQQISEERERERISVFVFNIYTHTYMSTSLVILWFSKPTANNQTTDTNFGIQKKAPIGKLKLVGCVQSWLT